MSSSMCSVDIMAEKFPDDVSITDLCDCGRHKRNRGKPMPKRDAPFPESDYASTFKAVQNPRPRSSKRPPESPRESYPQPMSFETNQRNAYKPPTRTGRPPAYAPESRYTPPKEPVDGKSFYQQEFVPKQLHPTLLQQAGRGTFKNPDAKFDDRTTAKEHFKHWRPQPALAFGELPSFTGSILFPKRDDIPKSTQQESYQGEFARRPDAIKLAGANIAMDGPMDLLTTHNNTYKNVTGDHRPQRANQRTELGPNRRGKFQDETQFKSDFPGYGGKQPAPAKASSPAPATLDLRQDNVQNFDTEQRAIYKGHDIRKNPVAKSCKKDSDTYERPVERVDTETCHKRDYKPIDMSKSYQARAVAPVTKMHPGDIPFDDRTTNKEMLKDWKPPPRPRYVDFHENRPYIPPTEKFNAESTTKRTYTPKKGEVAPSCKPEDKPVAGTGEQDFNTVYTETYKKPHKKLCRAEIYMLQQELKRRQAQRTANENPALQSRPIVAKA